MTRLVQATYEQGHLNLTQPLNLPEHQKVILAITIQEDDLPSLYISKFAEQSQSFQFLNNPQEDIYSLNDGQALN